MPPEEETDVLAQPLELARPAGTGAHVVRDGDTLASIADQHGHFWEALWNHPDNEALRAARAHPHMLLPGDRVAIPPLRPKEISAVTTRRHVFRRRGIPSRIAFVVEDEEGRALAGKRYRLEVAGAVHEGTTDGAGGLEHWIHARATTGALTVWPDDEDHPETMEWTLEVGSLEPPNSPRGVQSRLNALGFRAGAADGALGGFTAEAIEELQRRAGIEPTGKLDEATLAALDALFERGGAAGK